MNIYRMCITIISKESAIKAVESEPEYTNEDGFIDAIFLAVKSEFDLDEIIAMAITDCLVFCVRTAVRETKSGIKQRIQQI